MRSRTRFEASTLDRAMVAGGDDFLTKPFRPSELVVRVQAALRHRNIVRERDELHDMTRRQCDDARANEERFRTLVMTSSALVWQATADGHVDHEGWQQFTGVDAGRGEWGWLEAVHPADQVRVREDWTRAVAGGRIRASSGSKDARAGTPGW